MIVCGHAEPTLMAVLCSQRHFQVADTAVLVFDEHRNVLVTFAQFFVELIFTCFDNSVHLYCFGSGGFNTWIFLLSFVWFVAVLLAFVSDTWLVSEVESITLYIVLCFCQCREWRHFIALEATDLLSGKIRCSLGCGSILLVIVLGRLLVLFRRLVGFNFQLIILLLSSRLDLLLNHLKCLCSLLFINANVLCLCKLLSILLVLTW